MKDLVMYAIQCRCCRNIHTIYADPKDMSRYEFGEGLVQDIFPYLSANDRELLISGTCGDCYRKMFLWADFLADEDDEELSVEWGD